MSLPDALDLEMQSFAPVLPARTRKRACRHSWKEEIGISKTCKNIEKKEV